MKQLYCYQKAYFIQIHKSIRRVFSVFCYNISAFLPFLFLALTCVCGWWSNMSIWISWVEVEGVLDILLFCTIDLTLKKKSIFSFVCLRWCRQTHLFLFREGKDADVSERAGNIMATAASLQPIALHTGAPGFYTRVKSAEWRHHTSGYCFKIKESDKTQYQKFTFWRSSAN